MQNEVRRSGYTKKELMESVKDARRVRQDARKGEREERETIPAWNPEVFKEARDVVQFCIDTIPRLDTLLVSSECWEYEEVEEMLLEEYDGWKMWEEAEDGRHGFALMKFTWCAQDMTGSSGGSQSASSSSSSSSSSSPSSSTSS